MVCGHDSPAVLRTFLVFVLALGGCSGHAQHLVAAPHEAVRADLTVELTPYGVGVDLDDHSVHTLLVLRNAGQRPLAIAQRNIQLVDAEGTVAIPVARLSTGKVAAVRTLQVATAPLAIVQTVLLAPFLVVAGIVRTSVHDREDSARRVPEGWYWTEFILDPGREATVRLYYHDDRLRFDELRALRVVDVAEQPIELPLVVRSDR